MSKYIVMHTINESDCIKFPGSKVIDWNNGWYVIHIPIIEENRNN